MSNFLPGTEQHRMLSYHLSLRTGLKAWTISLCYSIKISSLQSFSALSVWLWHTYAWIQSNDSAGISYLHDLSNISLFWKASIISLSGIQPTQLHWLQKNSKYNFFHSQYNYFMINDVQNLLPNLNW